jgi:uncharacterized protein
MAKKIFDIIVKQRFVVLIAVLLLAVGGGFLGRAVKSDLGEKPHFVKGDVEMKKFELYKNTLKTQERAVTVFWNEGKPLDENTIKEMDQLVKLFKKVGLKEILWFRGVKEVNEKKSLSLLKFIKENKGVPIQDGIIWSPDQSVFMITGFMERDKSSNSEKTRIFVDMKNGLKKFEKKGRRLVLAGSSVLKPRVIKMMEKEQMIFLGGGVLFILLMSLLIFRSFLQAFLFIFSLIPAFLLVQALMSLMGIPNTAFLSLLPLILLVVALSDAIHLILPFRKHISQGKKVKDAVRATFTGAFGTSLFASLAVSAGFLSLLASGVPSLIDFGMVTAIGVMLTWCFSMVIFPALLSFSSKKGFNDAVIESKSLNKVVSVSSAMGKKSGLVAALIGVILLVGSIFLSMGNRVETFVLSELRESNVINKELAWVQSKGIGIFRLNIMIQGDKENPVYSGKNIAWAHKFGLFVKKDKRVTKVLSLAAFIEEGGRKNPFAPPMDKVDAMPDFMLKAGLDDFAKKSKGGLSALYNPKTNTSQIMVFLRDKGTTKNNQFIAGIEKYIASNPPPSGSAKATGEFYMAQKIGVKISRGFVKSSFIALGIIFLLMFVFSRSLLLPLMALVSTALPVFMLLGLIAAQGHPMSSGTLVVLALGFALSINIAFHFLGNYASLRGGDLSNKEVIKKVGETSGKAIIITMLALGLGFLGLLFTSFNTFYNIGFFTSKSLFFLFIANLFILPGFLTLCPCWNRCEVPETKEDKKKELQEEKNETKEEKKDSEKETTDSKEEPEESKEEKKDSEKETTDSKEEPEESKEEKKDSEKETIDSKEEPEESKEEEKDSEEETIDSKKEPEESKEEKKDSEE